MNPEWFAGRLRELRLQKGLSRAQLAEAAGMKVGGIRDLEQGIRKPALPTLIALCGALGVSCDSLLAEPGELPPPASGRPRKDAEAAPIKPVKKKGKGGKK
jgi:transcriptional regulator with XRE-family HTH domain